MKQYIISPISNDYLTKGKRYEVLCECNKWVYLIKDDNGDVINVNPMGSTHTRDLAWKVITEEETL